MSSSEKDAKEDTWRPMRKHENEATLKLFENVKTNVSETEYSQIIEPMQVDQVQIDKKPKDLKSTPTSSEAPEIQEEEDSNMLETIIPPEIFEDPILEYLDEDHSSLVYKLTERSAKLRNVLDVSDDFFDLTIADAQILLRDARNVQREDSVDQVLMTAQMRQTQLEGQKLGILNRYKRAIIRIQLPDRHVIQAIFMSGEPLSTVVENAKRYLINEEIELFVTPPKQILDYSKNLLDLGLVPAALVYVSGSKTVLKPEILNRLSNVTGAENALTNAGVLKSRRPGGRSSMEVKATTTEGSLKASSATSSSSLETTAAAPVKRPSTTMNVDKSDKKLPRWFNAGKQ